MVFAIAAVIVLLFVAWGLLSPSGLAATSSFLPVPKEGKSDAIKTVLQAYVLKALKQ